MVLCLHLHPRISIATLPNNDVLLSMRFGLTRNLPLKRSFAYSSVSKSPVTMATTESENLVEITTEETGKKKEENTEDKKEEVSLPPPPPEKPEPGDCCGSGCVRCVWDVYYEELEEYNKTLSPETKSNRRIE